MSAAEVADIHHPPSLTPVDIVHLAKSSSATLPPSVTHSTLISFLHSPTLPIPATTYLSSLLTLISQTPPSPSISSLLSSLLLSFLRRFRSRQIPQDKAASHVFHLFSLHLPSLEKSQLRSLLDLLVSDLSDINNPDDALPLDLLPRCLDLAVEDGGMGSAGPVLDRILTVGWSKALLVKMVSLLREFPILVRPRAPEFLEKVFIGMDGIDIQDLPSLVYQLLLLASKGFSRRLVIGGILGFFGSGSVKGTPAIIRQVEGTVLMHVNFAVKQDPSLGQEVMNIVRSDPGVVNHFAVLVLLSIARVRRFNEGVISLLRSVVVTSYRDYGFARECKWLPDSVKGECLQNVKNVEKALIRAVNESNCGREHIVPSIVQFGFVLLECVDSVRTVGEELMGIEDLSIRMLKMLFEVHDMSRNEIVDQCKFRILSLKPQQSRTIIKLLGYLVQCYPYPMLEHITRLKELLDYFTFMHSNISLALIIGILPIIKFSHDLKDYIILVLRKAMFRREDTVRLAATNAIIDLILEESKSRGNAPSSLQESSSQASCSQQADISCKMGSSLFQELSGLLRRCLLQQATVKEVMYPGLMKLVMLDPFAAGSVFDFLWTHFLQFYREDADFPLVLDACVKLVNDRVSLEEPLDCLLSCVSCILLLQPHLKANHPSEFSRACLGFSISQDNEAGRASSRESFSNALMNIRKALGGGNLKDMLGQSTDPSSHFQQQEKNSYSVWILSGILEVFINAAAMELERATDTEKEELEAEIMKLVDLFESLGTKYRNKQRHGARKGSSRTPEIPDNMDNISKEFGSVSFVKLSQEGRSFLAISSIHQLLLTALKMYSASSHFVKADSQDQPSSCKTSDRCLKLISFTLKVCRHKIRSLSSVGSGDPLKCRISGDIKLVGRPLLQLVWLLKSGLKPERDQTNRETKGKKNVGNKEEQLFLALTCLNELIKVCLNRVDFVELINNLVSSDLSEWDLENATVACKSTGCEQELEVTTQEELRAQIFLEKRIRPLYTELLALSLFHECEIISNMISVIGNKLVINQRDCHGVWADSICRSILVENSKTARSAAGMAICLRLPPDDLFIAQTMALELLKVVGSEDNKNTMKISETYPIINHSTASGIASELLQLIESVIVELDRALSKLKLLLKGNHQTTDTRKSYEFGHRSPGLLLEEALYSRSEALVNLSSFFAEMKLHDSQAEQFLKVTAKFYKILAQMTKLRIAPKGCRQLLPGPRFQKLAGVTCRKLTAPLYNFVFLVQKSQQENAQARGVISRIKRENRCIPDLIFQIEDYEKYLIQLSKLTKVNLLRHAKRSTARDFKIMGPRDTIQEEEMPVLEPSQANPLSSQGHSESGEESAGQEEDVSDKEILPDCSDRGGPAVEDSESDEDDQGVLIQTKRAKMSNVVQDSDEDE